MVDRGERRVLDGVSFHLPAGHALTVTGPNGAGKSTLLRAIAGHTPVAEGSVTLEGWEDDRIRALHVVAHLDAVKPQETVLSNAVFWVRWFRGLRGEAAEEAAFEGLEAVDLSHLAEVSAGFLSQGQRRRLALSRLLSAPRPIWLLDEPTAGLDTASRAAFATIMADHLAGGGLIVAATHEPIGLADPAELSLAA